MDIQRLLQYTPEEFDDLSALMRALSDSIELKRASLDAMLTDSNSHLYVLRVDGRIVACACLCLYHQPFQSDASIEAVAVLPEYRGQHFGEALVTRLIADARKMGTTQLHLTSRPSRVAANRLYRKLGFELRETNNYVMSFIS